MGIATTTPGEIRAELITRINAMTPTFAELQDVGWSYTTEPEPSGPQIRTYTILNGFSRETPGGLHGGGGVEYDYELTVRVAYGGLRGILASDLIDEDGRDLWLLLHPLPDAGGIDGLLPFQASSDPTYFDDEPGSLVVDFIFETHYKGRD